MRTYKMVLNNFVWRILNVFAPNKKDFYWASPYETINLNELLHIEQDGSFQYYFNQASKLLILLPPPPKFELYLIWQELQCYRLLNTIIASNSDSLNAVRNQMTYIRTELEQSPYISNLLNKIDSGDIITELVCSGHGGWFQSDGDIDLNITPAAQDVIFYSGPGAKLSDSIGADVENLQFKPEQVRVEKISDYHYEVLEEQPVSFSGKKGRYIPNLTLAGHGTNLYPRVLEPLTGRVLLDCNYTQTAELRLSTILEKFPNKKIHWAACTVEMDSYGRQIGEYRGHRWSKKRRHTDMVSIEEGRLRKIQEQPYFWHQGQSKRRKLIEADDIGTDDLRSVNPLPYR